MLSFLTNQLCKEHTLGYTVGKPSVSRAASDAEVIQKRFKLIVIDSPFGYELSGHTQRIIIRLIFKAWQDINVIKIPVFIKIRNDGDTSVLNSVNSALWSSKGNNLALASI